MRLAHSQSADEKRPEASPLRASEAMRLRRPLPSSPNPIPQSIALRPQAPFPKDRRPAERRLAVPAAGAVPARLFASPFTVSDTEKESQ